MQRRILIPALLAGFIILSLAGVAPALADNQKAIEYYNNGVELAYQGNFTQALEQIDLALAENQNFTLALTTKAGILNSLGQYQEALNVSDQAIAQNQSLPYAWVNKATALINLGMPDEALNASEQAIAIDPTIPEAWIDKGSALLDLGRYAESVQASRQALQLDPNSPVALVNYQLAQAMITPETPGNPTDTKAPVNPWFAVVALGVAGAGAIYLRKYR
ncbi:tetratricopeptide (TPR) repeat protein [Methanolinea mesophila]|uniref:tetratricopeptide repeat protein n=1 Tax=Methanolinea mesophila TaxID=547055 RepID=UPI001AE354FD|nr:tetratricopeptide repeat protein [Methanolinea mesophila]MBP1927496.1 tetratricopeptide (TPR) repeat protein [Methanolinea mesophila]